MWQEFCEDAIIYSLFNSSSQQSSLRQIDYKEKKWDIINEWFWLDPETVKELADQFGFSECYQDAKQFGKARFVAEEIKKITLSSEAKDVLDKANEIFKKTFQFRLALHDEHPEYHLQTWDAGWYQVKLIAKEFCKEDLKKFQKLYKVLEAKMTARTYEVGFLRK